MREIHAYGEIGADVSADFIRRELKAARNGPVRVRVNSGGGDVFEGNTIASLLRSYSGRVEIVIDGVAASAASYIAMTANRLVMAGGSFLMIHEPSARTLGTFEELRSLATTLEKVRDDYAETYAARSGLALDRIQAMMRDETWLDAHEAVSLGFADEVSGASRRIAACALSADYRRVPEALRRTKARPKPKLAAARASLTLAGLAGRGAGQSLMREANRPRVDNRAQKTSKNSGAR